MHFRIDESTMQEFSCYRVDLSNLKLTNLIGIANFMVQTEDGQKALRELENLELDLSYNSLEGIPGEIADLNLIELDATQCNLSLLPRELFILKKLKKLTISNNKFTQLPEELAQLTALEELSVGFNPLTKLPAELGKLSNLRKFACNDCKITTLPEILITEEINAYPWPHLIELWMGRNLLTFLPPWLDELSNIENLCIDNNLLELSGLPDFTGLTKLRFLKMDHNQLKSLPDALFKLPSLTCLDLGDNPMTFLPDSIGNLSTLTTLGIGNMGLSTLPATLANIQNFELLMIYQNETLLQKLVKDSEARTVTYQDDTISIDHQDRLSALLTNLWQNRRLVDVKIPCYVPEFLQNDAERD